MLLQIQAQAEIELRRRRAQGIMAYDSFQAKYFNDPGGFVSDCFNFPPGESPANYQLESLNKIPTEKRVSIRGPHGLGKTAMASWAVLWFALTRDGGDWKIPTLASAWRQLTKFLWPEIRLWARRVKWAQVGRPKLNERLELLTLSLKLNSGEAFALASDTPELIEGAHGAELLYLFDESKVIPPSTWDAAEGAFATGNVYWFAISTPGETNGRFYEIHNRAAGLDDWWVRHVTLKESIDAGRIHKSWADQRKKQWGSDSAVYKNRVLGEFASDSTDGVISLASIEAANEKWQQWIENERPGNFRCVGVDVGRGGDKSVYAILYEYETETDDGPMVSFAIDDLRRSNERDVMPVAGKTKGIIDKYGGFAVIDVIGVGAGVFDRLSEQEIEAIPFNAASRSKMRDSSGELGFTNKRSAAWWNLREMLNAGDLALPPDDKLIGDLTAPKWRVMSGGKIQIEAKEDIKKRLGRSTDDADAVVMALYARAQSLILFEV